MKVVDKETGKERDETAAEQKAREDAEKAAKDAERSAGGATDEDDLESVTKNRDYWKRESRKHEDQAKANAGAAIELKKLQDAQKSDEQKASEKAREDAESRKTLERDLARARVALKKGLSESQAKRLVGSTEEEMETDAEELLKTFKSSDEENETGAGGGVTRRPAEVVRSGTGKVAAGKLDVTKIVDEAMATGR